MACYVGWASFFCPPTVKKKVQKLLVVYIIKIHIENEPKMHLHHR